MRGSLCVMCALFVCVCVSMSAVSMSAAMSAAGEGLHCRYNERRSKNRFHLRIVEEVSYEILISET